MLCLALIDSNAAQRSRLRDALRSCAREAHARTIDVVTFNNVSDLVSSAANLRPDFYNAALLCVPNARLGDQSSDAAIRASLDALAQLRTRCPQMNLILASRDIKMAIEAYNMDARFFLLPGSYADLSRALQDTLAHIGWENRACLAVRTAGHIVNVAIDEIQFVESSKRGPVIHLPEGRTLVTRGTLRALFTQLVEAVGKVAGLSGEPEESPFAMAGNSFVVNLANVLASGKGALVFSDGETIIVPVRKRKEMEERLDAYRQGEAYVL